MRTVSRVRVARDGPQLAVLVHDSRRDGPTVVVCGNVHGDECTGVLASHQLDRRLSEAGPQRGKVVLYPSVNPEGLAQRSRAVPDDGVDLNRVFPGDPADSMSGRLAHALWTDIAKRGASVLIDLHADSSLSIPYAIIDRSVLLSGAERRTMDDRLAALAAATGLTVLHEYPDDQYRRFGLDRSLAGAMVNRARVPAITVEAGPRRIIDDEAVGIAVDAVWGVLAAVGVVGAFTAPERAVRGRWRRSSTPRTRRAGLFVPSVPAGTVVPRGGVLGTVRTVAGEVSEELRASSRCVVVSWMDGVWVTAGGVVGTLGIEG